MIAVLKPIADLAIKFVLNVHLLLIIIFSIFYYVPGAYIDDELFVEQTQNQISTTTAPVGYFSNVKSSLVKFYTLDFGVTYHNQNAKVLDLVWNKALFSFSYLGYTIVSLFLVAIMGSFLIMRVKRKGRYLSFLSGFNQIPQLVLIPAIIYIFSYLNDFVPLKFDPRNSLSVVFVVATLALKPVTQLMQMTIVKWQKEMDEVYASFAKAKGLGKNRILLVHTFKNVANSFLGYFLTIVLQILTGNFILESLYSVPGFGLGFMDSVLQRDLPLVVGYIFLFSSIYLLLHFLIQIAFIQINPRLRESE